jgi:prepilin-type N-terminal cleavage/methylation domain-containing protein
MTRHSIQRHPIQRHRAARRADRRRAAGFTLLEVLFAMTLFALVSTAVNVVAVASMRQSLHNRHGTAAVLLAQEEVENLRSLDYEDIEARQLGADVAGQSYAIVTEVEDDTPAAGMKQITVTVSWDGMEGEQEYVVETIFTALES